MKYNTKIIDKIPEDQWSCKRSPDIWAYYKNKTSFTKFDIGQGQLRVIIYICVELEFIMLHAKSHDQRTLSSVGKDF